MPQPPADLAQQVQTIFNQRGVTDPNVYKRCVAAAYTEFERGGDLKRALGVVTEWLDRIAGVDTVPENEEESVARQAGLIPKRDAERREQ